MKEGVSVRSNKEDVVSALRSGNDHIILALEIGLRSYLSTTAAVAGCTVGLTCDAVVETFVRYLNEMISTVAEGVLDFWKEFFIPRTINIVEEEFGKIATVVKHLPRKLSEAAEKC